MTTLCWLLGHDPQPKWDGEDPWCARCESYVPSEECRKTLRDRVSEMFARKDGG